MKRVLVFLLAAVMLASLCVVPTSAMSDADNGIIKVFGKADKDYSAYYESYGSDYQFGFDIQGYVDFGYGEQLIGSTYSNYGYHTFLNVDGANGSMEGILGFAYASDYAEYMTEDLYQQYYDGIIDYDTYSAAYDAATEEYYTLFGEDVFDLAAAMEAMAYDCSGELEQTIGGLKLKLENSYAGDGKYVKIIYTVSNPTSSSKKFSLATTADVQVHGDDSATLNMLPGGLGAKLISDDDCMFTLDGSAGDLDNIWIGGWNDSYFRYMFDDSEDDASFDGGDSAICWSWTDRTLAAGASVTFSVLMEVGINAGPEIVVDDDLDDIGETLEGNVVDPNLGTVDLYYQIDGGAEQVIENISVSGGIAPFSIPLDQFECGSTHIVKLWAIDDAGSRSDYEEVTVTLTHPWGMPEVLSAPTPTTPGEVLYTCTVCGDTKTEYIYCGDANGDGYLNSLDASLILKYDACIITDLTPLQLMLCDVNGDTVVNSLDAAQILKYDAGLITEFPNANFSLEAYIQLCIDYYGYYGVPQLAE